MTASLPLLAATSDWSPLSDPGVWACINFVVLMALLVKFAGPAIGKLLAGRRQAVAQTVASAEQALAEAQKVLAEQKRTEGEAAKILAEVAASARTVAASLVADVDHETELEVARAKEAAKAEIARERQAMLASVRAEILAEAFKEAEAAIRQSLGTGRQSELFRAFAAQAGKVRP